MSLLIVMAMLVVAGVATQTPPQIPCTFTSQIEARMMGKTLTYTQFQNNETQQLRFDGSSLLDDFPTTYGDVTWGMYGKNFFVTIESVIGHPTCAILPHWDMAFGVVCFSVPSYAVFLDTEPCPTEVATLGDKLCDVWAYPTTPEQDDENKFFLIHNSNRPVKLLNNDSKTLSWFTFHTWDTTAPDPSVFTVSKDMPCSDLRPSKSADVEINNNKHDHLLINEPANLERIKPHHKWQAGINEVFDGMTIGEFSKLLRQPHNIAVFDRQIKQTLSKHSKSQDIATINHRKVENLPQSFDSREAWPDCVGPVRNQFSCGSCWAFGAMEAMSDRACIASGVGAKNVPLSPQFVVDCYPNDGCSGGGWLGVVWPEMINIGAVPESCDPYLAAEASCPAKCKDGSALSPIMTKSAYSRYVPWNTTETARLIMEDLYLNGPAEACFWVFDDFMSYKGSVYVPDLNTPNKGSHCVKLIGYGTEDGVDYWLLQNSWASAGV